MTKRRLFGHEYDKRNIDYLRVTRNVMGPAGKFHTEIERTSSQYWGHGCGKKATFPLHPIESHAIILLRRQNLMFVNFILTTTEDKIISPYPCFRGRKQKLAEFLLKTTVRG